MAWQHIELRVPIFTGKTGLGDNKKGDIYSSLQQWDVSCQITAQVVGEETIRFVSIRSMLAHCTRAAMTLSCNKYAGHVFYVDSKDLWHFEDLIADCHTSIPCLVFTYMMCVLIWKTDRGEAHCHSQYSIRITMLKGRETGAHETTGTHGMWASQHTCSIPLNGIIIHSMYSLERKKVFKS